MKVRRRSPFNRFQAILFIRACFGWIVIQTLLLFETTCAFSEKEDAFVGGEMVLIPGGIFQIGIEEEDLKKLEEMGKKVPHMGEALAKWWFGDEVSGATVEIEAFYMDKHEVTNRQYEKFVKKTGYKAEGAWEKYAKKNRMNHPVIHVTWNDACAYAEWADKRLPAETEWEYAAKGGKDVKWFPWGNLPDPKRANYRYQGETFFSGIPRVLGLMKINTKPAGSYPANGYGLYDMCGNVSEWCEDQYKPYPDGLKEEWIYKRYGPFREDEEPIEGRVVRGGSWLSSNPVYIRITNRNGFQESHHENYLGFRCANSKTN